MRTSCFFSSTSRSPLTAASCCLASSLSPIRTRRCPALVVGPGGFRVLLYRLLDVHFGFLALPFLEQRNCKPFVGEKACPGWVSRISVTMRIDSWFCPCFQVIIAK